MRLQLSKDKKYIYVTVWDRRLKRSRRIYVSKADELEKFEKLFNYTYKVSKKEIEDYFKYYAGEDKLTRSEFVLMALEAGHLWLGVLGKRSEEQ